jgi:hypothetical protein
MGSVFVVRRNLNHIVWGFPPSNAAVCFFSKCRLFDGNAQCSSRVAGRATDNGGAGDPLKLTAAAEDVDILTNDIGYMSTISMGNEADICRDVDSRWRQINVSGIGPSRKFCVRSFCGQGLDTQERVPVLRSKEGNDESLKVVEYLNSLRNFEREGVPKGAGTESDAGFDLQRMTRLLVRLGDPLSKYPVRQMRGIYISRIF